MKIEAFLNMKSSEILEHIRNILGSTTFLFTEQLEIGWRNDNHIARNIIIEFKDIIEGNVIYTSYIALTVELNEDVEYTGYEFYSKVKIDSNGLTYDNYSLISKGEF